MLAEKTGGRPQVTAAGQQFTARSKLAWRKFSNWMLAMDGLDPSSEAAIEGTKDFFRMVLLPESRTRFLELMEYEGDEDDDDDESVLANEQMGLIIDDLLARYTGKANTNDNSATPSPAPTGQQSNVVSLTPRSA